MKSWPTKKLKDICSINGGDPAPQDYAVFSSEGIPFVRMQDLGRYHVTDNLTETRDKIKLEAIKKLGVKIFSKGSIILPRSGSVFANHRAILGIDAMVVSHIAILNNYKDIQPKYLFWYLTKLDIGRHAVKTSNVDSISFQRLGKFEIPVPPLLIQKQIVERLDKIAEAQKLNDDLIQKSDELFQSLLHQELNPAGKNWGVKRIGEVFERITESVLPTKQPDQEFNFIGLENIESNTGQIVGLNPTKGKLIKSTKTVFRKNDVLYGKLRPYLNKVWLADTNGICSTDIWVLRAKQNVISSLLLSSILRQQRVVMKSSASMAGANLPRANRDVFDKIAISLPPLDKQKQIVAKLSAVQEYKAQLLAQKSKLKELFNSALAQSFNG